MIKLNDVVTLHYSVYTQDGVNLDTSRDGEPLLAMIGSRLLIEGLEQAIMGKAKGDTFEVNLNPEQAYGPRHDNLVQTVPLAMFEGIEVEPGMSFRATTEDGEQSVIVIEVDDETAVVDGNHPLAGVPLNFDVEILDVRAPTESELENGKACKKPCCQH